MFRILLTGVLIGLIRMEAKSLDNWKAGYACLDKSLLNAAANRFYYSIFQAVHWYAQKRYGYKRQQGDKIHADMIAVLNKPGEATEDEINLFTDFLSRRITADYKDDTPRVDAIKADLHDGEYLRDRFLGKARAI